MKIEVTLPCFSFFFFLSSFSIYFLGYKVFTKFNLAVHKILVVPPKDCFAPSVCNSRQYYLSCSRLLSLFGAVE